MRMNISRVMFVGTFFIFSHMLSAQKTDSIPTPDKESKDNRNVMLNAATASGPRSINVGLPPGVGGTPIIENGLPVVYHPWPEIPTKVWRLDAMQNSLKLLDFRETGMNYGEVGYSVVTANNLGTDKLQGKINLGTNHYGLLNGTFNVSGPLNKKGLLFSIGAYANFDPGTFKVGYTTYGLDQSQIYKAALTQKYQLNGLTGKISAFYKYSKVAHMMVSFSPFTYHTDGTVEEYKGIKIGGSSFFEESGVIQVKNPYTGEIENRDVMKDFATTSHTLDIIGSNQFSNGWNLDYTLRYHKAKVGIHVPALIRNELASSGAYTYMDGTPYTGDDVYLVLKKGASRTPVTYQGSVFEFYKKTNKHNWKFGLTQQYYVIDRYDNLTSMYYQEVKEKPKKLIKTGVSDKYGNLPNYNSLQESNNGTESKVALRFTDSWNISKKFTLDYGARIEVQQINGDYTTKANRNTDGTFNDKAKATFAHTYFDKAFQANLTYKLSNTFGFTADAGYNETAPHIETYSGDQIVNANKSTIPNAGAGLYFNHPMLSLVSKVTFIKKDNYLTRVNMTKPGTSVNPETTNQTVVYDIETMGWTTDIIAKPFKGFNLHFLVTLQNPTYKNYSGEATFTSGNINYNFDGNVVTTVPKVLLEIDPSYQWKKVRVWASARYFSKTYANLSNTLFFAPRWETFAGLNYTYSKHLSLSGTVVNVLNQRGAQGTIGGTDLFNKEEAFQKDGTVMAGTYIRPFTVEFSAKYTF